MTSTSTRTRGALLIAAGLALIPWIGVLLGSADDSARGSLALFWVGLDLVEMVGLLGAGAAALGVARLRLWLAPLCLLTATLLAADALVDVSTAGGSAEVLVAAGMAACAELPLAAVCLSLLAPRTDLTTPLAVEAAEHGALLSMA